MAQKGLFFAFQITRMLFEIQSCFLVMHQGHVTCLSLPCCRAKWGSSCWLACHFHGGTCAEQGLWHERVCLLHRLDVQSEKQQHGLDIAAAISWHIGCAAGADG